MKPVLLPLLSKLGRRALARRGVESRWIETPGGKVHVLDAQGTGELPPVVLLHGLGSEATPFGPVLARLRRHVRRVVAPDYPGHGISELRGTLTPEVLQESIRTVLEALDVPPAILVGNSLGGVVALRYAIDEPRRVRGLVLVSPAGAHASEEGWRELRATFDVHSRADARRFLDRLHYKTPWMWHLLAHEMPAVLNRRAVHDLLDSASNESLPGPEELEKLRMPILLLWGLGERLLPDANLDYFRRHLPQQTLIERPEAYGHCPHLEDPADLARRIVAFAKTIRD